MGGSLVARRVTVRLTTVYISGDSRRKVSAPLVYYV